MAKPDLTNVKPQTVSEVVGILDKEIDAKNKNARTLSGWGVISAVGSVVCAGSALALAPVSAVLLGFLAAGSLAMAFSEHEGAKDIAKIRNKITDGPSK